MRKILAILFLFCALGVQAADKVMFLTLTVTNTPATSNTLSINGTTRTWTNATTATTILTNSAGINWSATNLFNALANFPERGTIVTWNNTNVLNINGTNLAITVAGNWAVIAGTTNNVTPRFTFTGPFDTLQTTNRTNFSSEMVYGIYKYSTNAFTTNAASMSNYISASPIAQSMGNKLITNGVINGARGTNLIGLNGTVHQLTNGYFTNGIFDKIISSNQTAYSFSAPGTGSGSTAISGNAAASLSVSIGGAALGSHSIQIGYAGETDPPDSIGIGTTVEVTGTNGVSIGNGSAVTANNGIAIGTSAGASHDKGVAIGYAISTTDTNQIQLGDSTYTVNVRGRITAASITNANLTGTNIIAGSVRYPRAANATLVNGNNPGIALGTNVFVTLSGPTTVSELAGFVAQPDGTYHIVQLRGAITNWVVNYTGSTRGTDGTAANRIETGNPASASPGIDISMTNNPSWMEIIYDGSVSRWQVISHSN